jgi:MATE family multidrug resistance protein
MQASPTASQIRAENAWGEFQALCQLAGPIAMVQLGMTAMSFVDVAMLGHYRADALAGMALGHTILWGALMFCMGVLVGVDPLLSQAVGARDRDAVTHTLLRGAVLALGLCLPAMLLMLPAETFLRWLGQKEELIAGAASYAHINTAGILPFLWFQLLRTMLSAHSRVRVQVVVIVAANVINGVLDWMLIFGRCGLPELGIAGAAWATVLSRWLMFLALLALSWRDLAPHLRRFAKPAVRAAVLAWPPLRRLLRLGTPIGVQFAMEMGVFALTALLIGWFGEHQLGGHQVALQLASLSFMVPLGLSMATAVRVGWAVGRGDAAAARLSARVALSTGAAVMSAFMLLFLLAPTPLARVLTNVDPVLAWAAALIPIAGVFQVGDGLQVTAIGCLRGIGDTKSPMLANVVGFWVLGLPIGCGLGFGLQLGPAGLWWGLCAGLFAVALGLLWMVRRGFGRDLARLSPHA